MVLEEAKLMAKLVEYETRSQIAEEIKNKAMRGWTHIMITNKAMVSDTIIDELKKNGYEVIDVSSREMLISWDGANKK